MPGPPPLHEAADSLVREISDEDRIEGLASLAARTHPIIGRLITAEATAGRITHVISDIHDRLIARVLELTEARLGPPPLPYCWILFGSEGRREQTFKTDQDNALIFGTPPTGAPAGDARRYFRRFAEAAVESLIALGFPRCPAGYMASTAAWCQPLSVWESNFSTWMNTPVPDHLLKFLVFCDFRPVHGEAHLARELRESVTPAAAAKPLFLGHLANTVLEFAPPVGFFRTFVVERSGEHKDHLDLKVKGMTPLVNAVRFLAVSRGVADTNTLERLRALRDRGALAPDHHDELVRAFEFVMTLRIRHQFEQIRNGSAPDNFINPDGLSRLERKTLKESFTVMTRIQDLILELYKAFVL